ncbi:GNAT family N-acetyltransferase [Fontibacillus phaseoli]|nr:GNAT family N-acetyltransferase [Fontibacillus phaseoli]
MTMVQYYRATEVEMDVLHAAFQTEFSDYIIQFNFTMEQFADRFFGPEGNAREHSFVALRGDMPIGIALGGIKTYEGIRTMRLGSLAIDPEERGQGVSGRLMELHREEAVKQGCRQLMLEVIVGNDRAIAFYRKQGYSKVYDLSYFSLNDMSNRNSASDKKLGGVTVSRIDWDSFESGVESNRYFHVNWQNDLEYIQSSGDYVFYGAFHDGKRIGTLGITSTGRISILFVDPSSRCRGAATLLLETAVKELALAKMSISMTNNALMEGFLSCYGFQRDSISLYEMYITL